MDLVFDPKRPDDIAAQKHEVYGAQFFIEAVLETAFPVVNQVVLRIDPCRAVNIHVR